MLPASMPLALAFSSGCSIAPPRLIRPACRPGAVRLGLGFGMGMGMGDVAKLPFIQSAWNEIVDADAAMLQPDIEFLAKAENAAALILKAKRTTEETDSLVPFIRDGFYSIHRIDTRVCNQEVRAVSMARTLRAGAIAWGVAIAVQKRSVRLIGKVLYPWWVVGIVVSLLQWAFYVNQKLSLITNARDVYKKPEARS